MKNVTSRDGFVPLPLSTLPHTWLLDLDGTLLKHNGYKLDGEDSFLDGAEAFLKGIDAQDTIILLTSRKDDMREGTERFLLAHGIRFDAILYNIPYGERILINDDKPSGLGMAIALRKERDAAVRYNVTIEEDDKLIPGEQGNELTK